jgi:hypothetical protein
MKKLLIFISLLTASVSKSQSIYIHEFYKDSQTYLIHQEVFTPDSLSAAEIKNKIINWGSVAFVDLNAALVGQPNDQMVFNYISSSFYMKSMGTVTVIRWYIRLVVKISDGKVVLLFFDDGNAYKPGYLFGSTYIQGVAARTNMLTTYFRQDGRARKNFNGGLICLKTSCEGIAYDLITNLK